VIATPHTQTARRIRITPFLEFVE